MNFPVTVFIPVERDVQPVTIRMVASSEIKNAGKWAVPENIDSSQSDNLRRAEDAREFAQLAAKRWRYYEREHTAASNFQDLKKLISDDPEGEYCFFLGAFASWHMPEALGMLMLRRTWCGHIFMEFLFVHPSIAGRVENIRGLGPVLLRATAALAQKLKVPVVWGEATRGSHKWYREQLDQKRVADHFFIRRNLMRKLAKAFSDDVALARETLHSASNF